MSFKARVWFVLIWWFLPNWREAIEREQDFISERMGKRWELERFCSVACNDHLNV